MHPPHPAGRGGVESVFMHADHQSSSAGALSQHLPATPPPPHQEYSRGVSVRGHRYSQRHSTEGTILYGKPKRLHVSTQNNRSFGRRKTGGKKGLSTFKNSDFSLKSVSPQVLSYSVGGRHPNEYHYGLTQLVPRSQEVGVNW